MLPSVRRPPQMAVSYNLKPDEGELPCASCYLLVWWSRRQSSWRPLKRPRLVAGATTATLLRAYMATQRHAIMDTATTHRGASMVRACSDGAAADGDGADGVAGRHLYLGGLQPRWLASRMSD